MPWKEATFWVGITVFGTGLYFVVDHFKERTSKAILLMAGALCLIGAAAVGYSIYAYYVPAVPQPPSWVGMLLLTWAFVGFDLYSKARDKRRGAPNGLNRISVDDKLIKESDPRIYLVAISQEGDNFSSSTPFVVENRGGGVAHFVHIARGTLKFGYQEVGFIPLDNLAVNAKAEILPWIDGASNSDKHTIIPVLLEDGSAKGKVSGGALENLGFSFAIMWQSFDRKTFETSVDVNFKVLRYIIANRNPDFAKSFPEELFDIRHSDFKRLS
jgi:hypothetical protein